MNEKHFDYIVIGGGSTGCVVAGRLSENPNVSVLLLDRGTDVTGHPDVTPTIYNVNVQPRIPIELQPVETLFAAEPKLQTGMVRVYASRALGGGPAIGGGLWSRGDPGDYNGWAQMGNPGWSYRDVLPYLKKSESYRNPFHPERPVSEDRGVDGPIHVGCQNDTDPTLKTLLETGSRAFQSRILDDYNTSAGVEGFAPMQLNFGHDIDHPKLSTAYTKYVRPYLSSRPNLRVIDMATVVRIHFRSGHQGERRAERVQYLRRGETHYVDVGKEIILCGGAMHSPKILLQSGIGPAQELEPAGIASTVDLPGVGKNLQNHCGVPFLYQTNPDTIPAQATQSPVLVAFLKSPGSDTIDLELNCCVMPNGTLLGFILLTQSDVAGSLHLSSTDPLAAPAIQFNIDPDNSEMDKLIGAFRSLRKWLFDGKLVTAEIFPGLTSVPIDADETQWKTWFSKDLFPYFHMAGTCKMGPPEDAASVVDHQLRLRGVQNMRVADCSIMPRLVVPHPFATAVMIGEKLADMIARA